jgi:membrane protease YdiL (CAAX protease family)
MGVFMMQIKKSVQFIVLTCVVSWVAAGTAILIGLREAKGFGYVIFAAAYMLLPSVCAIILQIIHREKPFRNLNISFRLNWWFLVAGFAPIACVFMALGINLLFPNVSFSGSYEGYLATLPEEMMEIAVQQLSKFPPAVFLLMQVLNALLAGYTINAVFALGEELGWRGYLLKALYGRKLLPVSLIIGSVWGLWHFPLILIGHNYPQHRVIGVGMMMIFCILLTPMMIYIVIKSKSVITAAFFHGALNASAGLHILFLVGGNDLTNGITGLAGFLTLLMMNILFYIYDKYITKENIFTKVITMQS